MRLFLNLKLLFLLIFLNTNLYSKDLTKVTIQLSWFDQFQFAGYYMAKEQGFYKDAGLDVEILPFSLGMNIPKMVNDGDVDFAPIFDIIEKSGYEGYVVVEAEQDPAKANPLEYAMKARKYIAEKTGL